MHPGSTHRYALLATRFVVACCNRLDAEQWSVSTAEFGVEVGEGIRYPDVLIAPADIEATALATDRPVVIVEILSPSSVGIDMTEKLAEYTSLASLQAYVVASQDEVIAWVWQRDAASGAFPARPHEIAGRDAAIVLAALDLALPMAELYRGIKTGV
jgi:Uma2 family endonuclease